MIFDWIQSALFPTTCLCCRRASQSYLCPACISCPPLRTKRICPVCQKVETHLGSPCTKCFLKTPLDGIFSAVPYKHPTVHKLVRTYKYNFARSLAEPLGQVLLRALLSSELPLPDLMLPVPLHPRRLRYRGFNQAELLAQELSAKLLPHSTIPLRSDILLRTRYTSQQAKTDSRDSRLKNLKNAFDVPHAQDMKNKALWIVDDVSTTGSTLSECALALKRAGARSVWGVVLAS
jgi:ComF family protein